jgi:uncharacterized protein
MATNPTYPGVYIEEVPSAVRTIVGVPTSVAAFIGFSARGPTNEPVQIFSYADFERAFGGLHPDSPMSYAVSHFFLNGGAVAWIVRVANGAAVAAIELEDSFDGAGNVVLTATARGEGAWGNGVQLAVDFATSNPASLFNLSVTEMAERGGRLQAVRSETFRNLSMDSFSPSYAVDTVNAASNLITLARPGGLAFNTAGVSESGIIEAADLALLGDTARTLAISLDGGPVREFDIWDEGDGLAGGGFAADMTELASRIEARVQALAPGDLAYAGFTCGESVTGTEATLTCTAGDSGVDREHSSVTFRSASRRNAAGILSLGLANGGRETAGAAVARPAANGTLWERHDPPIDFAALDDPGALDIDLVDGAGTTLANETVALWAGAGDRPGDPNAFAAQAQAALNALPRPEFAGARVTAVDGRLVFVPGGSDGNMRFTFNSGPTTGGGATDFSANAEDNSARYLLGSGAGGAQSGAVPGSDGSPPMPADLEGSRAAKSGLYALEDVDLFNILLLPGQTDPALQAVALAYAEERRSFVILDLPGTIDTLPEATAWLAANGSLRHRNAAAYFPRILASDPLQKNRVRAFPNSGFVAGLYSRTDGSRGVWKAPAGTEASLRSARGLEYVLTDGENGVINPLGLNALRNFPAFGPIAWGARTLLGSDALASEWKYVPIRRLALFLEESLYRGTQWVVFEPNDEPLWAQIRLNVGAFMHNLFRQGAFQGASPRDAYFVKCDSTTTTQDDINLGIVNIEVGFAPLKPAEFVIIKLEQIAGQAGAGA